MLAGWSLPCDRLQDARNAICDDFVVLGQLPCARLEPPYSSHRFVPAMTNGHNIILCGGPVDHGQLPIGASNSYSMVPVNGKPVIGWILDDLIAKNLRAATIVVRDSDRKLRDFLQWAYQGRTQLNVVPLETSGSILHSLHVGLSSMESPGPVRIILGDTLIRDTYTGDSDFAYVDEVPEPGRWCLIKPDHDGNIRDYIDKHPGHTNGSALTALAGYYHLRHSQSLQDCLDECLRANKTELSDCLTLYGCLHPIQARRVTEWYDFGHIDNLVDSRRRLLQSRKFNTLTINPVLNTITKISDHNDKLKDELNWYLSLPDELKVLTPRVLRYETNGHVEVVQDYYGYPTLAELYVYGDLQIDLWYSIIRRVLQIHQEFQRYTNGRSPLAVQRMYADKTFDRLDKLRQTDDEWKLLLDAKTVTVNGRELKNLPLIESEIRSRAIRLADSAKSTLIHGDMCFSNILFDVTNQITRLIDPRGSFGEKGIHGDPRYDIAKLRHSISGLYDFILADLFELTQSECGRKFETRICANGTPTALRKRFDQLVVEAGYDLGDIRWIEGLLFVSMVPLHSGEPSRQRMMYLNGIQLFNEAMQCES